MRINIRNGTRPSPSHSLCENCRSAAIIRGTTPSHDRIYCNSIHANANRVDFTVTECTMHVPRSGMYLNEMQQMAWLIDLEPEKDYNMPTGARERRVKVLSPQERRDRIGGDAPIDVPAQ
jgi:hypothetical protein